VYETRTEPMLTRRQFAGRLARHAAIALAVVAVSLYLGAFGYHETEGLPWLDSVLNASMLLSGMGPLHNPVTTAGKLFATAYALFSGVVFLALTAVMLAPVVHRVVHAFHLDDEND
jgi:hypothetical protein